MCTREDGLAYISGVPSIDDIMSYNSLTTETIQIVIFMDVICFCREMQQIERRESMNLERPNLAAPSLTDSEGFKRPTATTTNTKLINTPGKASLTFF